MDVAQLVERLLPTSEIRGSNTVNGKIIFERLLSDENNEKRPGMPPQKNHPNYPILSSIQHTLIFL